ncbi:MAG TPA: response regulator [Turneriella sp.]|nr:response regulator [Turneriella sp.]HNE20334.1 response regulator [Turneriella sp.]HNJ64709.1 response regulator [Turneriella sp.]HNL53015.1 response regulator [Turneriella sp.]HNN01476.1 response regulator [Turneriella sp.]
MAGSERILILEDDLAFARLMGEVLKDLGQTRVTSYPERLPQLIAEFAPTLLIVDYNLNHPTMNGIKATRLVKQNPETALVPVLLLSGEDDLQVIEEAFKSGIEDYVLKPVIPRFLIAKIENILFQTRRKLNAQALSGLPGNAAIETEFYLRLQKKKPFSAAYTDLDHFKPFNDEKGVKKGDDAIQCVAKILYGLRANSSREQLFVGHIGGDDFLLFGSKTAVAAAARRLRRDFRRETRVFFTAAELRAGGYRGTDRQGSYRSFPLLDISTAIIDRITADTVPDFSRLTELAARAKKAAKNSTTHVAAFDAGELKLPGDAKTLFVQEPGSAKKNTATARRAVK